MSTVEDLRKSLEKLVIPDLQALKGAVEANEKASKLRDDALSEKIDQKFDVLAQRISEIIREGRPQDPQVRKDLHADGSHSCDGNDDLKFGV